TVGSLTFAESGADKPTGKAGYQGLFFKWGSLIGVSAGNDTPFNSDSYLFIPDLATGKYYKVAVGGVGTSNIQAVIDFRTSSAVGTWDDSGGYTTWDVIPYALESDVPSGTDRYDSFLTYSSSSLHTSYKGDICKYLSDTKDANGSGLSRKKNWKMPVSYMFGENGSYSGSWNGTASFTPGTAPEDGTATTSDGLKTYHDPAGINETVTFPASGFYSRDSGLNDVGNVGSYWSSSSLFTYEVCAYRLVFYSGSVTPAYYNYRSHGHSVRCVRSD
ncbi:MAG: fibrobacter succinogenes major paralogous domain-containing protein, partial [Prevotella sp.]|nr:fibrobacter succinogenes major paralogous domain-containing protein [Prevotella sp.]